MSVEAQVRLLVSEIEKHQTVLARIAAFYDDYLSKTANLADRTPEQAIVVADLLTNYYTCLETVFLRISQFFENSLIPDRWHQDLLDKMTLRIEGVREAVLSEETAALLLDLLKFRHFKRYYFEFTYDWDRLDYLQKKMQQARPAVAADLDRFTKFLQAMAGKKGL